MPKIINIGSQPANEIIIKDKSVYSYHAKCILEKNHCLIKDKTGRKGRVSKTWLVRSDNPEEKICINDVETASYKDIVYLGDYEYHLCGLVKYLDSEPKEAEILNSNNVQHELQEQEKTDEGKIDESIFLQGQKPSKYCVVTVGSDEKNRITIKALGVSPYHAEFCLAEDGCFIKDSDSDNGTYLVDPQDPNRWHPVTNGVKVSYENIVLLGTYKFKLKTLKKIKDFFLNQDGKPTKIGRSQDMDCCIVDIRVSKLHAQFVQKEGKLFIEDMGSTNGTFLNEYRLFPHEAKIVNKDDTIKIGSYEFFLDPIDRMRIRGDFKGNISLRVENLGYKEIIKNITFTVCPGEFIGILGPSGHGKSVLLETIIGYQSIPTEGKVTVNSKELLTIREHFQSRIGYVPQGEVFHPQLTVRQSLVYSAKLWLPSDLSKEEVNNQVDNILQQLKLTDIHHSPIRLLSGGQQRRVNLAYELIRSTELIFLDEPTTGLSVLDAKVVIQILKERSEAGRTIITVIHQPSLDIYNLFDLVGILFKGRLIYFGPPKFSFTYFECSNEHPEEIFYKLETYEEELTKNNENVQQILEQLEHDFKNSDFELYQTYAYRNCSLQENL